MNDDNLNITNLPPGTMTGVASSWPSLPTDLAGFITDVVNRRNAALATVKECDEILIQARSSIPKIRRRKPVNGKPKKSPGRPRRPVADPAAEWRTQPKVTPPDGGRG